MKHMSPTNLRKIQFPSVKEYFAKDGILIRYNGLQECGLLKLFLALSNLLCTKQKGLKLLIPQVFKGCHFL
jgi:hypothetical protein